MKLPNSLIYILFAASTLAFPSSLMAQSVEYEHFVQKGDSLRTIYRFEEALTSYSKALEVCKDSVVQMIIKDKILLTENGKSMAAFADDPVVVAKHRFSVDDFFLYFPLEDKSWRKNPNQLDTIDSHKFQRAAYVPDGTEKIYYSAEDQDGIRNIYVTELLDTLWSVPELLNEQVTSASDEILPVISADGKSLYFSSLGLYGVGGYDLYVSEWDEDNQDWGTPVNLGFPYSSPADDFLYINTPDGKYTMFASNRDCGKDSVWVYVLEFDNMPVRKAVSDPLELQRLSALKVTDLSVAMQNTKPVVADVPENVDTRRYMSKMTEVRNLRDSIARYEALLESDRSRYSTSEDPKKREKLRDSILKMESNLPVLQDSLNRATQMLQEIEMEFLFSGVVIDPEKLMAEADREIIGKPTTYTFSKMSYGDSLKLNMMTPEVKFDYSFKVLEEGQFAEDNNLPGGIVYQIQMFLSSRKATVKSLKGLSPVFETKTATGKYIYRVGLFSTYKDVLAHLNTVKRVGFKSAYIVAFSDGKSVSVAKARSMEQKKKENPVFYEVRIVPDGGDLDSAVTSGINQQSGGKDIARIQSADGVVTYVVGPFSSKSQAEEIQQFVKAMGVSRVTCNVVGK